MRLSSNSGKFSIPTIGPRDIKFRSRMELRWAEWFDKNNIEWEYEAEGFEFDGYCYLPDFWLPECRAFVEVKGVLDSVDEVKLMLLAHHAAPKGIITAIVHDVRPSAEICLVEPGPQGTGLPFNAGGNDIPDPEYDEETYYDKRLERIKTGRAQMVVSQAVWAVCKKCHKHFILDVCMGWKCWCCGHYDGDKGFHLHSGTSFGDFPKWAQEWSR